MLMIVHFFKVFYFWRFYGTKHPNPQYLLLATNSNHLNVSKELVIEMWQHLIILQVSTGQNILLMTGNILIVIFKVREHYFGVFSDL